MEVFSMKKITSLFFFTLLLVSANIFAMRLSKSNFAVPAKSSQLKRNSRTSTRAAEQSLQLMDAADVRYNSAKDKGVTPFSNESVLVQSNQIFIQSIHEESPIAQDEIEEFVETPVNSNNNASMNAAMPIELGDHDALTNALFCASLSGDVYLAKLLIDQGALLNATLPNGKTPLHIAAELGHMRLVQFLVVSGADRDAVTANGKTAKQLAQSKKRKEVVKFFNDTIKSPAVSKKSCNTKRDRQQAEQAPIIQVPIARPFKKMYMQRQLMEQNVMPSIVHALHDENVRAGKAPVEQWPAMQPINFGPDEEINYGLEPMVISEEELVQYPVFDFEDQLVNDDEAQQLEGVISQAFNHEAVINILNKLAAAIEINDLEKVRSILAHEGKMLTPADLDMHVDGHPLIQRACFNLDIIKELVERGVYIDGATKEDGVTALYSATCWNKVEIIEYLLAHGADPLRERTDFSRRKTPYAFILDRVKHLKPSDTVYLQRAKTIAQLMEDAIAKKQNMKKE